MAKYTITPLISDSKQFAIEQVTQCQLHFASKDGNGALSKKLMREMQLPKKHRVAVQGIQVLGMFLYDDKMLLKTSKRSAVCPVTLEVTKLKRDMLVTPLDSSLKFEHLSTISAIESKKKKKATKADKKPVTSGEEQNATLKEAELAADSTDQTAG